MAHMNNEEVLTLRMLKSPITPDEYFYKERKYQEREMMVTLLENLEEGEWYSIRIDRDHPYNIPDYKDTVEKMPTEFYTKLYIGRIKPTYMEYKPPKKLTIKQRLIALFTGNVPYLLEMR